MKVTQFNAIAQKQGAKAIGMLSNQAGTGGLKVRILSEREDTDNNGNPRVRLEVESLEDGKAGFYGSFANQQGDSFQAGKKFFVNVALLTSVKDTLWTINAEGTDLIPNTTDTFVLKVTPAGATATKV
jgi:hypothetical protein